MFEKIMGEQAQFTQGDASVNSIIGEGTTLKGEFDLNGLLRIDGKFFGKVKTSGKVLVGKNGFAECSIVAGIVVIGGKVKGEVFASEKITLLSTGEMTGTIKTARLVIEEGVIFNGRCEVIEDREKLDRAIRDFVEEQFLHIKAQKDNITRLAEKMPRKGAAEQQVDVSEEVAFSKVEKTQVT